MAAKFRTMRLKTLFPNFFPSWFTTDHSTVTRPSCPTLLRDWIYDMDSVVQRHEDGNNVLVSSWSMVIMGILKGLGQWRMGGSACGQSQPHPCFLPVSCWSQSESTYSNIWFYWAKTWQKIKRLQHEVLYTIKFTSWICVYQAFQRIINILHFFKYA